MARTVRKSVHIALSSAAVEAYFDLPARKLRPRLDLLPPELHMALRGRLETMLRKHLNSGAAHLAFILCMSHPVYGKDAQDAYLDALRMFDKVVVSIALHADGIGFSVGDGAAAHALYVELDKGVRGKGVIGEWPVWH